MTRARPAARRRTAGVVTAVVALLGVAGLVGAPAAAAAPVSKPAIWDGGDWYLRDSLTSGVATSTFRYGRGSAEFPVMGDWDGDGTETVGVARWEPGRDATLTWYLRNSNSGGGATVPAFTFGEVRFVAVDALGTIPIAGDWDGDGDDTVGLLYYDQNFGAPRWLLADDNVSTPSVTDFFFGTGRDRPIVGDWDGDGDDTVGVYREPNLFFLRNENSSGTADVSFPYGSGAAGTIELPIAGDWNGDGVDTIGVLRDRVGGEPTGGFRHWLLRDSNSGGAADRSIVYGSDRFGLGLPIGFVPRLAWE